MSMPGLCVGSSRSCLCCSVVCSSATVLCKCGLGPLSFFKYATAVVLSVCIGMMQ